jgi:MFS family permease
MMAGAAVLGGRLSDRFGRKPVMILPRIALLIVVVPAFMLLLAHTTPATLVLVTALLTLLGTLSAAAALTAIGEAFPNQVRSSGFAVSYAISVSVFGGSTQFIVAWLIGATGNRVSPGYYVVITSIISLWAMFRLPLPLAPSAAAPPPAADR